MKRFSSLFLFFIPLILFSQTDTSSKGIKWVTGLSWEQVKQRAKAENKFIFLDCFTTWCGPCKMMDRDVYTSDSVARYFNDKFISVKVQMDKTKKDNQFVQNWYKAAAEINDEYHVEGYPTFIFLNPNGIVTEHQMGYKGRKELVTIAQTSMQPGKVYNDPYSEYNGLVTLYKKGNKNYDKYPLMITMANKTHDDSLCHKLLKEFNDYMVTLKPRDRYTKERIEMWDNFTFTSTSRVFKFFYKDSKFIDKVMNQNGYANAVIDKTIWAENVIPFLKQQAVGSKIPVTGGYITDISGKHLLKTDSSEADWKKLDQIIRKKYNKAVAERNVIAARIEWYTRHWNYLAVGKYRLIQMNKYWTREDAKRKIMEINNDAFSVFLYSKNKTIINGFISWLEKAGIQNFQKSTLIDTYANLLYKAGRIDEALKWEERASHLSPTDKEIQKAIEQMKKGEPTYGAVWVYE